MEPMDNKKTHPTPNKTSKEHKKTNKDKEQVGANHWSTN